MAGEIEPDGDGEIQTSATGFSDEAGNIGIPSDTAVIESDRTPPQIVIDGPLTIYDGETASMTYTSTELIVDFENYDIEVYNGVSENFVNQGDTLFTSTITGAVPRQTFVNVNEQGFTDLAGNEGGPVDEFTIDIFTGTFETQAIKRVNVYPNPATGFIQIGSVEAINRIGLFHIDVTIIKTYIFAQGKAIVKLDVSGLSSGVYILKVLMDTKISTTKIVKR